MDQFAYRRRHHHGRYRARVLATGAAQARGRAFVNSGPVDAAQAWTGEAGLKESLKGEHCGGRSTGGTWATQGRHGSWSIAWPFAGRAVV